MWLIKFIHLYLFSIIYPISKLNGHCIEIVKNQTNITMTEHFHNSVERGGKYYNKTIYYEWCSHFLIKYRSTSMSRTVIKIELFWLIDWLLLNVKWAVFSANLITRTNIQTIFCQLPNDYSWIININLTTTQNQTMSCEAHANVSEMCRTIQLLSILFTSKLIRSP
jgi:hypothetical protein